MWRGIVGNKLFQNTSNSNLCNTQLTEKLNFSIGLSVLFQMISDASLIHKTLLFIWPFQVKKTSTYWCSIWKLRCPVNQSLKRPGSTLVVEIVWAVTQSWFFSSSISIGICDIWVTKVNQKLSRVLQAPKLLYWWRENMFEWSEYFPAWAHLSHWKHFFIF